MTGRDPFRILELEHGATDAEIKSAYRRLVRLYHPDNNPGFPDEAAAKLRELRDAHDQALGGWTPPPVVAPSWVAPAPQPREGGARRSYEADGRDRKEAKRRARAGGRLPGEPPPWTPPPPNRHENPPRQMDPPTVPPKPKPEPEPPAKSAPTPPEPKYVHVPPAREEGAVPPPTVSAEELAALAAKRAMVLLDLVATGFAQHVDEFELDHAILDALLPVLEDGERVHACTRYDDLAAAGEPAVQRHEVVLLHPAPDGEAAESVAESLVRGRFVAVTQERLLWTVSRLAPASGPLLQERLDVHAEPLTAVARVSIMQGGVGIGLASGLAMRFRLEDAAAVALQAALGR